MYSFFFLIFWKSINSSGLAYDVSNKIRAFVVLINIDVISPVSFAGNNGSINSISDRGIQLPGHREVTYQIFSSHSDILS